MVVNEKDIDNFIKENKIICDICKKELPESNFYTLKSGHKDNLCKECRCAGCSDDKPWTFFKVMHYYDIPYIEAEWLLLIKQRIKKVIAQNGQYTSVFGKYFSKMKLKGYEKCGFYDSAHFNYDCINKNKKDRELFLDKSISDYLNILIEDKK